MAILEAGIFQVFRDCGVKQGPEAQSGALLV